MQAHETCEPWIGVLLDEAGGRSPLPAENELGEAFAAPCHEITFSVLLRQCVRVSSVTYCQAGHRLHALRDAVQFTGLVGQNTDHLMYEQATGRCLQGQGGTGDAEVMDIGGVGFAIEGEVQAWAAEGE